MQFCWGWAVVWLGSLLNFFSFFFLFSSALFEWCLIALIWKRSSDDYGHFAQVGGGMAVMGRGVSAPASAGILERGLV